MKDVALIVEAAHHDLGLRLLLLEDIPKGDPVPDFDQLVPPLTLDALRELRRAIDNRRYHIKQGHAVDDMAPAARVSPEVAVGLIPAAPIGDPDLRRDIEACVERIPDVEDRAMFRLHWFEGLTLEEIAQRIGKYTSATISKRIARSELLIRRLLWEDYG